MAEIEWEQRSTQEEEMEMSDKTPPAWAIEAAKDIYEDSLYAGQYDESEAAKIIQKHSPDAEPLVNLLEYIVNHDYRKDRPFPTSIEIVLDMRQKARNVLDEYRAKFPKLVERAP